jgi:ubiquinone/menaquinone biosynthesis C-methylase UbiE
MSAKNQSVYTRAGIVNYYAQLNQLQPAEKAILTQLKDRLPTLKMLDIGIGGGRTTHHFQPLVKDYTGIDYAPEMIGACQQRFAQTQRSMALAVVDARDMHQFEDDSFDFVLFSFNGIDYVSHADRLKILQEIHRVGKPGGYFLFSSHNLQAMARGFDYRQQITRNPLKTYVNVVMWALLRLFNAAISQKQINSADYLILKDESHNFRLQTYYIRPEAQTKQLEFGFKHIEMYPWRQDQAVTMDDSSIESNLWLYYFCRIKDSNESNFPVP